MRRRGFLQLGLAGGALLVGGGAGLALWPPSRRYAPRRALAVLDPRGFAVLAAFAERVVTAPGADPAEIAHRIDETLALGPPEAGADLGKLLALVDSPLAGLLFDGRPRNFTRLEPVAQEHALRAWRDSSLAVRRTGYQALRKLAVAAHYSQASAWASTGYPGPPDITLPADWKVPG